MTKSRGINAPRWLPTPEQLDELRRDFATTPTEALAQRFGVKYHQVAGRAKKLGLRKNDAYLQGAGGRLDGVRGMGTRFSKGHVPWSKGRTLPVPRTAFKPGHKPFNHVPIGSLRIGAGYLQRKVTDTGYPPRDWVMVHRLVWEAAHGPIPEGHVVAFLPGRRTTALDAITLDALELVNRAEHARRNSINRYPKPVQEVMRLRGRITREINQRTKGAA